MARLSSTITNQNTAIGVDALEENLARKIRRLDFWHWNLHYRIFQYCIEESALKGLHYGQL